MRVFSFAAVCFAALSALAYGPRVEFKRIGSITPRSASEIESSNWVIGCETLDRDFIDFRQYCDYVAPLGIKMARLQGGWAKCEKTRGVYDFAWLDEVVDFLAERGVKCAIETDYGNPVYPGGGGFDLAGGFPSSDEALAAWDRWVDVLTRHFATRVDTWLMWNEPDIGKEKKTAETIAAFNVRTARIVRRNVPSATIAGLSLAHCSPEFMEECLAAMGGDISLFDAFIYHGYDLAPETSYAAVERVRNVVARLAPKAYLWQGENGAPSEMAYRFALSRIAWSETSQAKWDMRRMLGDLGHDIRSSVFTICDFNHKGREMNLKGLLRANEENEVVGVKRAYRAVQNVAAVFDSSLVRVRESGWDSGFGTRDASISCYHYVRKTGEPVFVFWAHGGDFPVWDHGSLDKGGTGERAYRYERPGDSFETREAVFRLVGAQPLADPVWVDMLTGGVYAFPKENQLVSKASVRFVRVPVYDSPCLLTERGVVLK